MNKKIGAMVLGMLAALVLSACAGQAETLATFTPAEVAKRTLMVQGNGEVSLQPDMAIVSIGVSTESDSAEEALTSNSQRAQKVIQVLKNKGVDEEDIRTTNFSISPQQEWGPNGKLLGVRYRVNNTVQVTVRNIAQLGAILDEVVRVGANNIRGIQFDVADKSEALKEARQLAVVDARTQAEQLAEAAGVTLGAVQTISVRTSGGPVPIVREVMALDMAAEVPVSPGQLTLSVQVNVVYEIH